MTVAGKDAFTAALESTCRAFRLGMEGEGSEQLVLLIDSISVLMAAASQDAIVRLSQLLTETLGAIERKDYLWAADMLEYEIAPLLAQPGSSQR